LRTNDRSSDNKVTREYAHLLPQALFTYNLTRSRTLRVNYGTRINPPSVVQLQPVADYSDPLNIRLGNPDLKPEYIHHLTVMFNSFHPTAARSLFAVLTVSQTENKIVNSSRVNEVGAQTTHLVNRSGVYAASGFLALGYPLKRSAFKANLNLTTNLNYNRGISLINDQVNTYGSYLMSQGISLNTNMNARLELSIGGQITYRRASYSLQSGQGTAFFNKTLNVDLYYQLPFHLVLTSDLIYNNNTGRSTGYNQHFTLWNVALTRQLFKNQQGELKIQVYDLLNQNRSVVRNVGDTYVEDVQSRVLTQYFMLSFTYHLRKFGGKGPDRPSIDLGR
jgi:outer membrane receptor protein involved in Fe transport